MADTEIQTAAEAPPPSDPPSSELLAQNIPPPGPVPAPSTTPVKWKSDGRQWVADDGSGKTKPFTSGDYIKALPPGMQSIANKLRNFDIPYPAGQLAREAMHGGGAWTDALNAVAQDPDWAAADYDAARKAKLSFSGAGPTEAGGNINAMSTAITHLQAFKNSAKDLANWNMPQVPVLNNLATPLNRVRDGDVGSNPKLARLSMAQDALAGELTKVFRQGTGASADVEGWKKNLGLYNSLDSQNAASDEAVELISNRIRQLRQFYIDNVHRPPQAPFLKPDARAILKGLGYDPDAVESGTYTAPGGVNKPANVAAPSDMIPAQIPGQPPGQIHRSQAKQFLADNPGATVKQ